MITKSIICQVLEANKDLFNPMIEDGILTDHYNTIANEILAAPGILEAKWIAFTLIGASPSGKTNIYQVRSKENPNILLGIIKWYPAFRCYSFFAAPNTIFEPVCMGDICNFINMLMQLRATAKKTLS